jgi:hypothetical protein
MLHRLRTPVTAGGEGDLEAAARRRRALQLWEQLVARPVRIRQEAPSPQPNPELLQRLARVLDTAATELYFASGAYGRNSNPADERLEESARSRFYDDAGQLLDAYRLLALPQRFHSIIRDVSVRQRDGRQSASQAAS